MIMRHFFLFSFLLVFTHTAIFAQTEPEHYVRITYYDTETGELILSNSDQITAKYQDRVDQDIIVSWRMYHVLFSSNAARRYRFVTVETAKSLNDFESESNLAETVRSKITGKRTPIAKVHSEIWGARGKVVGLKAEPPARYKNTNFMTVQPGRLDDYHRLESQIAAPLHQHLADSGKMEGWNFYRLIFPTGSAVQYNFITADYYSKLEQIEFGITPEVMAEIHPELDQQEFEEFADTIRERVWSDLWELVLSVE